VKDRGSASDAAAYRERLRRYSNEDLEDVYFNIHILRSPLHYKILLMEMESRGLRAAAPGVPGAVGALAERLARRNWFRKRPAAGGAAIAAVVLAASAGLTLLALLPVWVCLAILDIRGIQASLVYLAWGPIAVAMAAAGGCRMSGRTPFALFALAGLLAGLWLFGLTGAPEEVLRVVFEPRRGGPSPIMGGF
jgi:hypothetical protein